MTRELIPLETIMNETLWVAKMQGWRESGTYAEIGHLAKSEECRDFDIAAKQPAHLTAFYNEFWKYTKEHGFITVQDYYRDVYAAEPAAEPAAEMTRADFDRLMTVIRGYDFFPEYIDSYKQECEVRERNEKYSAEYREILAKYGVDDHCPSSYDFNVRDLETKLTEWLAKRGVTVEAKPVPARRVWTEDEIRHLIATNDKVLIGALMKLYAEQTADERSTGETRHNNGRGFNGTDSRFLSSVAEFYKKRGFLTDKQKACVRRKLAKYNKQLTRLANAG